MTTRVPSLSGLGHVVACPGSLGLPKLARVSSPAAALGTAIHRLIQWKIEDYQPSLGQIAEVPLHPDDAGRLAFLAAHLRLPVPPGAMAETSLGMFLPTRDAEVTPCTVRRIEGGAGSYPDVGQVLSGQLDIMWAEPEALTDLLDGEWLCQPDSSLWVVDIKTGDEANVPPVDRNWQVRGAALLAARWTGATRVIPAIVFINAAECAEAVRAGRVCEGRWEVGAPLDAVALDGIETEARAALARAKGESDDDVSVGLRSEDGHPVGGDRAGAPLILGPHCEHCDSRAACPAFGAEARNLIRLEMLTACVEDGSLTPKGVSYLAGILPALKSTIARAEEAVRAHAEAHGPVLLADGREYGPALEGVVSFKTQETFDALSAVVGEDEANKAAELTAASIKRALDGAPRGAFSALMKDVEARGGLVRGAREVWRKRWPTLMIDESSMVVSDGGEVRGDDDRGEGDVGRRRDDHDVDRREGSGGVDPSGAGDGEVGGGPPVPVGQVPGDAGVEHGGGTVFHVGVRRALCSVCRAVFSVTKTGRMRRHHGPGVATYCQDATGASPFPLGPAATTLAELVEAERGLT